MVRVGGPRLFLAATGLFVTRTVATSRARSNSICCGSTATSSRLGVISFRGVKHRTKGSQGGLISERVLRNNDWGQYEIQGAIRISVAGASHDDAIDDLSSHGRLHRTTATVVKRRQRTYVDEEKVSVASVQARPVRKIPTLSKLRSPKINIRKISTRQKINEKAVGNADQHIESVAEERPSPTLLKSLCQPLIPKSTWRALTGKEFFSPSCLPMLQRTGIRTATASDDIIEWKPDKHTQKLVDEESITGGGVILRNALDNGDILVWKGRFRSDGYGSDLPLIKTTWTLDMAPKAFAELLMDSSRVKAYNKMSLGRSDVVTFQEGIDSSSEEFGDGEAKIVRNLTKPPLSKRNMEFVTLMNARQMEEKDDAGIGIMGGCTDAGYVVVSRAVGGNGWADCLPSSASAGVTSTGDEFTKSEILLGVNVIRAVPGQPGKSEVTAVTHCNSPSVPRALAGKVGVKGAVDFVRDVRSLCK